MINWTSATYKSSDQLLQMLMQATSPEHSHECKSVVDGSSYCFDCGWINPYSGVKLIHDITLYVQVKRIISALSGEMGAEVFAKAPKKGEFLLKDIYTNGVFTQMCNAIAWSNQPLIIHWFWNKWQAIIHSVRAFIGK